MACVTVCQRKAGGPSGISLLSSLSRTHTHSLSPSLSLSLSRQTRLFPLPVHSPIKSPCSYRCFEFFPPPSFIAYEFKPACPFASTAIAATTYSFNLISCGPARVTIVQILVFCRHALVNQPAACVVERARARPRKRAREGEGRGRRARSHARERVRAHTRARTHEIVRVCERTRVCVHGAARKDVTKERQGDRARERNSVHQDRILCIRTKFLCIRTEFCAFCRTNFVYQDRILGGGHELRAQVPRYERHIGGSIL